MGAVEEVDIGDHTAIAPGIARGQGARPRGPPGRWPPRQLTADQFARDLAGPGIDVVVRSGGTTLASTLPAAAGRALPRSRGSVTIGRTAYQVVTADLHRL